MVAWRTCLEGKVGGKCRREVGCYKDIVEVTLNIL